MSVCKTCGHEWASDFCVSCKHGLGTTANNYRRQTNAEHIRAMTDEELAGWISHIVGCPLNNFLELSPLEKCVKNCKARNCWAVWLKSPVEDGA